MITYNVKLKFAKQEDYNNLLESLKLNQLAWNIISEERFSMTGGRLKILHDKCYYKVKEAIPTIPSQFIIKAEQDVIATYKTIKSNKHKLESPAIKKNLSIQLDKRIYKWIDKTNIKITTLDKQAIASFDLYDKLNQFYRIIFQIFFAVLFLVFWLSIIRVLACNEVRTIRTKLNLYHLLTSHQ